ncbi:hypothetical protein HX867_30720 [Pseudomonas gingeri]|uniref:hypothetical protein n=1 Tax=Pseudomonas gingeri TaxID=117681 RepID=UPI0015A302D3|nr:hypothetical protein [Pseudomonas gingeri]NVZ66491.1 hypothetical protein [Pseudomonas gingeri]NVZ74580.1 hypothetical protein [Pseudomonas gingeri]
MADIEDFETGESTANTPQATTGELVGMLTPLGIGLDSYFEATSIYRGTVVSGGTRVLADIGDVGRGRRKVEFTLSEADLPSGTYPLPSEKIKNVLYATQPNNEGAIKTYPVKSGEFVLVNRAPELYLAGHFRFETHPVENLAYLVAVHRFEIKGQN